MYIENNKTTTKIWYAYFLDVHDTIRCNERTWSPFHKRTYDYDQNFQLIVNVCKTGPYHVRDEKDEF
jgi:hypothetical protein